jgi:hypothetical protein
MSECSHAAPVSVASSCGCFMTPTVRTDEYRSCNSSNNDST